MMTRVVFPCDQETWWLVKDQLVNLKQEVLQGEVDLKLLAERHQVIVDTNLSITHHEQKTWGDTVLYGLVKYFRKRQDRIDHFLFHTFPAIVDLALEVEAHLPTEGIFINQQQRGETREISRQLCCSIVACGFLCLFPDDEERGIGKKLNLINFRKFFCQLPIPSQCAKLECVLHFFDRVSAERSKLTGNLTFTRQVMRKEELPTLDTWLNCTSELCEVLVQYEGRIEDAGCNTVEVDFANRSIGGGALSRGRVQEEIRFMVCPELIVSMLFMETMEENEAILISGYEQFSDTCGYAASLEFVGDHQDPAQVDEHGNLKSMLCAIDAVSYRGRSSGSQYQDKWILRDVNKAFIGFCTPYTVTTIDPVSEEDYYTPEDSQSHTSDVVVSPAVDRYLDELLAEAFSVALLTASRALVSHDLTQSLSSNEAQNSLSSLEHYLHRQSSMDHLEVNFRDWCTQFRRRSSNLSDLSSRRSSCDIASRRSSACSAKGYSSEFSSEFEEYFDNFQMQDQKYKYHTIKEEVGSTAVLEFAASLAASLLQQGTHEAVTHRHSPHCFQDGPPPDEYLERPTPVRVLSTSMEEEVMDYVSDLVDSVWPFTNDSSECMDMRRQILDGCKHRNRSTEILLTLAVDNIGNLAHRDNDASSTSSDSATSRGTEYSIVEVDDEILTAVADRIVTIAFQEALLECKYSLKLTKNHICHSYSESSQSDHSMDAKDQSDTSLLDTGQTNAGNTGTLDSKKNYEPAMKFAEKMVSGLFCKKETLVSLGQGSGSTLSPSQASTSRGTQGQVSSFSLIAGQASGSTVSPGQSSHAVSQVSEPLKSSEASLHPSAPTVNTPESTASTSAPSVNLTGDREQTIPQDCDTEPKVVINTIPTTHSASDSVSQRQLDMYGRIADRLLHGGLASTLDISSQCNVGSEPKPVASSTSTCDHYQYSSHTMPSTTPLPVDKTPVNKHVPDNTGGRKRTSSDVAGNFPQSGGDGARNKDSGSNQAAAVCTVRIDVDDQTETSTTSLDQLPGHVGARYSPDTSSSSSSGLLGAVGGAPVSAARCEPDVQRPPSQSKIKPKPSHPFFVGNRKNYDQFANSLSRDLLTNAFLQVQEHPGFVSYPRRSSEPMQISNDAALQRLEHTAHIANGKRSQKSKTDEDISNFDYEWNQQFTHKSTSGFRDPVLSRFAEELMKANVCVPSLQLLGDAVSVSSSSQSVCSTMSSFRDPLLASFEEELLINYNQKPSAAKTQTSWSKMKGLMCSPRQGGRSNSLGTNLYAGSQGDCSISQGRSRSCGFRTPSIVSVGSRRHSADSRRHINISISQDSDASAMSFKSAMIPHRSDVSSYADSLSRRVLCEAMTAACCTNPPNTGTLDRKQVVIRLYAEMLASTIVSDVLELVDILNSDWLEQNKMVTWSDELETGQNRRNITDHDVQIRRTFREWSVSESAHSSGDYEDALDVPYQRLEEFADVLATKVLINSVAISRREHNSHLRRQHGRPIATGNWGCGAFQGDPHLKSLLQWIAASYAGTPCLMFYTFQNPAMDKFHEVVEMVLQRGWDVSKLMQVVRRYCITANEEIQEFGHTKRELFDVILQGEIFPGV